jgi:hypothetical protein
MSTNGKATDAEIAAILSGGREQIDRYLVTCAIGTKRVLDDLPESIAGAVSDAVAACRADTAEQREKLDALWTARTEARGVYRFWGTMGKVLAAACAGTGLFVTLASFIH